MGVCLHHLKSVLELVTLTMHWASANQRLLIRMHLSLVHCLLEHHVKLLLILI